VHVIVDAGVGTASHAAEALELGCDAVRHVGGRASSERRHDEHLVHFDMAPRSSQRGCPQ
jgi:GTP cyclohydrolase III